MMGYTRQAFYKSTVPNSCIDDQVILLLLELTAKARKVCPGMGCRAIYEAYSDQIPLGRDKAVDLMLELGLGVKNKSSYIRTTETGLRQFSNLLVNKEVGWINQVWQADMTYYITGRQHYYIILITDVYSQRIIGHGAFIQAFAENFLTVLNQAIRLRKRQGVGFSGVIHHSDGGKQYEAMIYKARCLSQQITQSMCIYSWENPYAENSNHQIKNRYLKYWKPESLQRLKKELRRAVYNHNHYQSKKALGKLSPVRFEEKLLQCAIRHPPYILQLKPKQPETVHKTHSRRLKL